MTNPGVCHDKSSLLLAQACIMMMNHLTSIMYYISVFHFTSRYMYMYVYLYVYIYVYSLEWEEIQWRDVGDEGAIALADPQVFKNFKTLK